MEEKENGSVITDPKISDKSTQVVVPELFRPVVTPCAGVCRKQKETGGVACNLCPYLFW